MEETSQQIAIITNRFPSVSETFIALQIAELIKKGYKVKVVSLGLPKDSKPVDISYAPEEYKKVAGRIKVFRTNFDTSEHLLLFIAKFLKVLLKTFLQHPRQVFKCSPLLFSGAAGMKKFKNLLYDSEVLENVSDCALIHCQFADLADRVVAANKLGFFATHAPIIFSVRGYDITKQSVVKNIDWPLLSKRCAMAMPVCQHFKTKLEKIGWEESKINIIPSSIDTAVSNIAARNRFMPDGDVIRVISVGRLTEKKGFDDAIQAMKHLSKHEKHFRYDIIGEGELSLSLNKKIKNLGLQDNIRLLGKMPTSETLKLMSGYDILLAPSKTASDGDSEGIPNVIKEAMMLGLQVVATDHSGIPELVKNNETGILVNENAPEQIAAALLELITNVEPWAQRSKEASRLVSREYSAETSIEKLMKVYERSLNPKSFISINMYPSKVV